MDTQREPPEERASAARIAVMTVNPNLLHVYWQISDQDLEDIQNALGKSLADARTLLRFYDITSILFDGTNAHRIFDVEVDFESMKWNVPIWSANKSYLVDLGVKTSGGRFYRIGRSNVVHVPRDKPSPRIRERYLRVEHGLIKSLVPMATAHTPSRSSFQKPLVEIAHGMGKEGDFLDREPERAKDADWPQVSHGIKEAHIRSGHGSKNSVQEKQAPVGHLTHPFDLVQMTEERLCFAESSQAATPVTNS